MIRSLLAVFFASAILISAGCTRPAEEAVPEPTPPAEPAAASEPPAAVPLAAATPETGAEATPAVALPEGLPTVVHVYPEITVTEAKLLNADENQYEIKGETRRSVVQVMNYYIKYFRDDGWEEDMIMEHEGNTVVSFKKDGILQYVDATEGGYGCFVTITTGNA